MVATNGVDATIQGIATVKDADGSQKLALHLPNAQGPTQGLSWIYDTDYVAGATWDNNFFFANFMDETKTSKLTVAEFTGRLGKACFVWEDKRVFAHNVGNINSGERGATNFYKILEEMPCSELCLTCDDIWRRKCLTCQPNSSLTAGSGSACSCDLNYYQVQNGILPRSVFSAMLPSAAPAQVELRMGVSPVSGLEASSRKASARPVTPTTLLCVQHPPK